MALINGHKVISLLQSTQIPYSTYFCVSNWELRRTMLRLHLSLHCCCTCLLMLEKAKIGSVMSGEAEKIFFLSLPVCSHFQYFYHQLRSPFKEKQTLRLCGAGTFCTDDKTPSDSCHLLSQLALVVYSSLKRLELSFII